MVLDNVCSVTGDSRTLHVQVVKTDPLLHVSCIFFSLYFVPLSLLSSLTPFVELPLPPFVIIFLVFVVMVVDVECVVSMC